MPCTHIKQRIYFKYRKLISFKAYCLLWKVKKSIHHICFQDHTFNGTRSAPTSKFALLPYRNCSRQGFKKFVMVTSNCMTFLMKFILICVNIHTHYMQCSFLHQTDHYSRPLTCCSKFMMTSTAMLRMPSFVWGLSVLRCVMHILPSSFSASLMSRIRIL